MKAKKSLFVLSICGLLLCGCKEQGNDAYKNVWEADEPYLYVNGENGVIGVEVDGGIEKIVGEWNASGNTLTGYKGSKDEKVFEADVKLQEDTLCLDVTMDKVGENEGQTVKLHQKIEEDNFIDKIFAPYEDSILAQKQEDEELTITLNHVVFEPQKMIFDYTLEAPNAPYDYPCIVRAFSPDGMKTNGWGGSMPNAMTNFPENDICTTYMILEWDEEALTEDNIGDKVSLQLEFMNPNSGESTGRIVEFEVEIAKLYAPEVLQLDQTFADTEVRLASLEVSPFYMKAHYELEEDEFIYRVRMKNNLGETLQMIGPNHEDEKWASCYYMPGDVSAETIELFEISYDEDGNISQTGKPLVVEVK